MPNLFAAGRHAKFIYSWPPCPIYYVAGHRAKFIMQLAAVPNLLCSWPPCPIYYAAVHRAQFIMELAAVPNILCSWPPCHYTQSHGSALEEAHAGDPSRLHYCSWPPCHIITSWPPCHCLSLAAAFDTFANPVPPALPASQQKQHMAE